MTTHLLEGLNAEQQMAVSADPESALVLAGAGSGKTRVLVHRIAWLCHTEGFSPYAIVAVTFTNKAAQEMRERVRQLVDLPIEGMWLGTFHSLCHRILRTHHEAADLQATFQVIDSQDQQRLIKRIINTLGISDTICSPKDVQSIVNSYKESGKRCASIQEEDARHAQILRVYAEYETYCRRSGLVDFAELLLRVVELLRDNPAVLERYQKRFRHILIDEFQDTNLLQYSWVKLLAGADIPVFAVGDDDQSIYSWRGARSQNIQEFVDDFKDVKVYRLEQNYRSTGTILRAANELIKHNKGRMGKKLWTQEGDGSPILVFRAFNEREEASFVIEQAMLWQEQGRRNDEFAVLYRSNAQSRVIEEELVAKNLPYRVYGGMRFYERSVIKHALAYLRLASNRNDDPSFERIVNFPPRGIGERTLASVRDYAKAHDCSLWDAGLQLTQGEALGARSSQALSQFYMTIAGLNEGVKEAALLIEPAERVVQLLQDHYRKKTDEASLSSIENLEELLVAVREFEKNYDDEVLLDEDGTAENILDAFLTRATLESGDTQAESNEDCIQLMTLHSAKGLEFPSVIIVGLEENLFPHERSMNTMDELEEERRLCYVGITRAREQLVMSYAEERRHSYSNHRIACFKSRFLEEIPDELVTELRRKIEIKRPSLKEVEQTETTTNSNDNYELDYAIHIGESVQHNTFGDGVVVALEGSGENSRALVRFATGSEKWLVLAYAKLEIIPQVHS